MKVTDCNDTDMLCTHCLENCYIQFELQAKLCTDINQN